MQDSQSAQTPDQTNNQRKQFHIQFNKIISPIMLEGGERSQRGKEKDGCDPVDGSNKLCMAWISWVFLHKLPLWHENRPKCLNPRSTKQVPIWLRKIFGPTIFWGGERSQRGKEKDGCDHPLTEAISYRHITWLLVGDFLRLKSGDDKKWCQSSPAS